MTTHAQIGPPTIIDRRPTYDATPTEPAPLKPFTATPLGDNIAVRRIPEPVGLIEMPDVAKDKPIECEVLATSPTSAAFVSKGDKVLIRRFSGTEVKVNGEEITLILIQDVLLKL